MVVTVTYDKTTVPGYMIVKFTGAGTIEWECPFGVTIVDFLVVGGGGGGSYSYGGGGGSGNEDPSGTYKTGGNGGSGVVILRYELVPKILAMVVQS